MAMSQMSVIKVTLTHEEEVLAHKVGLERAIGMLPNGLYHSSRRQTNINYHAYVAQLSEAVGSEMAVAKYLGITDFVPTCGTFKSLADIADNIEVKWTTWKEGPLYIQPSDRDDDIALLVTGKSPELYIMGWLPISRCKIASNFVRQQQNWWVSQRDLMPMSKFDLSRYAPSQI